jgi:Na+:H+ antiporter, NhaA family
VPARREPPTFLASDRRLARSIARPIRRFLDVEAASGLLLVAAVLVSVGWASSPWSESYHQLWATDLHVSLGDRTWGADLHHWVNDGAMVLFFFVIGLEVKQELVVGRLTDRRVALLPVLGALGGVALPAIIYALANAGTRGSAGWAIPMATDVAFAVGVLALLGNRVPAELATLLLALAIVDDIAAVVVIALFYGDGIDLVWLAVAVSGLVLIAALQRARVWWTPVYLLLGAGVWAATLSSGVHATLAGVALGLLAPARPLLRRGELDRIAGDLDRRARDELTERDLQAVRFTIRESTSVAATVQHLLHPWTAFGVVPLFALANAGVEITAGGLRDAATSRITLGVVLGLVVGKTLGIAGAIWLGVRARLVQLPEGLRHEHIVGMAAIAGIGFTVSLFVARLAFDGGSAAANEATLGILTASVVAAALGWAVLRRAARRPPAPAAVSSPS